MSRTPGIAFSDYAKRSPSSIKRARRAIDRIDASQSCWERDPLRSSLSELGVAAAFQWGSATSLMGINGSGRWIC
jgi:hypothetical protein